MPDHLENRRKKLSAFPKRPNFAVNEGNIEERKRVIVDYLQSILAIRHLRNLEGVLRFFEISPLSFRLRLGSCKYKEGPILKIPKARRIAFNLCPCCISECFWQSRWLVLKDTYLVVLKPQKLVNEEEKAGQSKTSNRTGSQETVSTTADVENGQMTHGRERRWHRGRRWRYCKVILVDQFFNYFTKPSSIGPVFHVGNMHG
nr:unnamed protein product [Spirometra erinaceieuropaei]